MSNGSSTLGDLRRSTDLERSLEGVQYVYHLARANVKTWEEFTQQDIEVTRQVALTCLARNVKRLIYTGRPAPEHRPGTVARRRPIRLSPGASKRQNMGGVYPAGHRGHASSRPDVPGQECQTAHLHWATCAGAPTWNGRSKASNTSITWREQTSKHGRSLPSRTSRS